MLEVYTDEIRLPTASTYVLTKEESPEVILFKEFLGQFYRF